MGVAGARGKLERRKAETQSRVKETEVIVFGKDIIASISVWKGMHKY